MNTLLKKTGTAPKPIPCSTPTTNACKQCTPLGASLAFRGFEGCVPFLHGSQGCATYIRRYLISHFREPVDIASSSFSEQTVVFGGKNNLFEGLFNVIKQYRPKMIAIATTCLAETIGDDLNMYIREFRKEYGELEGMPYLVPVSTPSYVGTQLEGYWNAVRAVVETIPERTARDSELFGFCPGMVSPADIRYMHEILKAFHMRYIILPDYSETLDGGSWNDYMRLPPGGTPLESVRELGNAAALVSFTSCLPDNHLPGAALQKKFGSERFDMPLPIGVEATDQFMSILSNLAGISTPAAIKSERTRLIDAYVDGHKITSGRRVAVFGDAEIVVALTAFLREIGLIPVLCAAGGKAPGFESALRDHGEQLPESTIIRDATDFADIEEIVEQTKPDIIVGNSKGYPISRRLNIPLLRVGFPVHDRMGGQRILHWGYRGSLQLFDNVCNLLLEHRQSDSPVGYSYM